MENEMQANNEADDQQYTGSTLLRDDKCICD